MSKPIPIGFEAIGRAWLEDSSLETWFPFTADELKSIKRDRDELRAALQRLLRAFESDYEQVPDLQIRICWEINSMAVAQARAALAKTEPKP